MSPLRRRVERLEADAGLHDDGTPSFAILQVFGESVSPSRTEVNQTIADAVMPAGPATWKM